MVWVYGFGQGFRGLDKAKGLDLSFGFKGLDQGFKLGVWIMVWFQGFG